MSTGKVFEVRWWATDKKTGPRLRGKSTGKAMQQSQVSVIKRIIHLFFIVHLPQFARDFTVFKFTASFLFTHYVLPFFF